MHDLGTLGGRLSIGHGINSHGQVAGWSLLSDNFSSHAFLYDGTLHDLGTLGGAFSYGLGINASGQVTGYSNAPGFLYNHAFLHTSGSGMVDLNMLTDPLSGWELTHAYAINDAGQIAGYGQIGGETHAFLLTPVPEPTSVAVCAVGLSILFASTLRRSFTQWK
jgi:probable HAF family extracellular repeat protein